MTRQFLKQPSVHWPVTSDAQDMLEDHKRTSAYFKACVNNRKCFEGRTVLDVGTGSGILAIFAAKVIMGPPQFPRFRAPIVAPNCRLLVVTVADVISRAGAGGGQEGVRRGGHRHGQVRQAAC